MSESASASRDASCKRRKLLLCLRFVCLWVSLFASFASSADTGVSPDNFSVTCVLKALASSSSSPETIHCFVLRRGLDSDVFVLNALVTCYCRCYEIKMARKVAMLGVAGVSPNAVMIVSVMQACGQSKDLLFGMEVHCFVNEKGIGVDVSLCNAMISMYAKCGSLDYARELFDETSEKDEVSYGLIISGYMVYGFVDKH